MLAEFESILKRAIGLDAASIGTSAVERAVQERMQARREPSLAAYRDAVLASPAELQELVEAVVVPETWFFRDPAAFSALARLAAEKWLQRLPNGGARLLSFPCSTGEEPYTMAMAMLDSGFPAAALRIDAVDISERALALARRATYGKNSFRGGDLAFRDRHFEKSGHAWRMGQPVRELVTFRTGNLVAGEPPAGAGTYDAVFCRNVLIYFDRATQDRAVATLRRLLAPGGQLFVAPSETGLMLSHGLEQVKIPLAFAFREPAPVAASASKPTPPVSAVRKNVRPPPALSRSNGLAARLPNSSGEHQRPVIRRAAATSPLDEISTLADQGHLVEAAQRCEAYLRDHPPSARAYYLLGLVRDAAGNHAAAADLYRKALYLEPNHVESMQHLAVLLEQRGDAASARVLSDRARRMAQKQPA